MTNIKVSRSLRFETCLAVTVAIGWFAFDLVTYLKGMSGLIYGSRALHLSMVVIDSVLIAATIAGLAVLSGYCGKNWFKRLKTKWQWRKGVKLNQKQIDQDKTNLDDKLSNP